MIGLDSNILVSAIASTSDHHKIVLKWLDENETDLSCPLSVVAETLRVISHPKVFPKALTLSQAISYVESLLDCYHIAVLQESATWWKDLMAIAADDVSVRGNVVFDARICLCLKFHQIKKMLSFDSDIDRFKFITRISPLA